MSRLSDVAPPHLFAMVPPFRWAWMKNPSLEVGGVTLDQFRDDLTEFSSKSYPLDELHHAIICSPGEATDCYSRLLLTAGTWVGDEDVREQDTRLRAGYEAEQSCLSIPAVLSTIHRGQSGGYEG